MSCLQNCAFGDKEQTTDLLFTEKHLATLYCEFMAEAATPEVLATLSGLLGDTQSAQRTLFQQMNSRGWYPVTKAEDAKVNAAKQQYGMMVTA